MATALEPGPLVAGRRIEVRGTVQGVGFRPWVYRAGARGGHPRPRPQRRRGSDDRGVRQPAGPQPLREAPRDRGPARRARPRASGARHRRRAGAPDFAIAASRDDGARRVSIPPELATCPDCLAEVFDPADRRYLYPFTNCTNCGPRYSIALDAPYDRPATTMAAFTMCAACRREYDDPLDRRFHAQPNACPACGPSCGCWAAAAEQTRARSWPWRARATRSPRPRARSSPGGSSRSRAWAASTSPATPRPPRRCVGCASASGATRSRSR